MNRPVSTPAKHRGAGRLSYPRMLTSAFLQIKVFKYVIEKFGLRTWQCRLLKTLENSLNPDQARTWSGYKLFDILKATLKDFSYSFFPKANFENQQTCQVIS